VVAWFTHDGRPNPLIRSFSNHPDGTEARIERCQPVTMVGGVI
jgi:hypothetical protein